MVESTTCLTLPAFKLLFIRILWLFRYVWTRWIGRHCTQAITASSNQGISKTIINIIIALNLLPRTNIEQVWVDNHLVALVRLHQLLSIQRIKSFLLALIIIIAGE